MTTNEVHCECGETTGERCAWTGPRSHTELVEWMPLHHRASHAAAGNSGTYPHNGARRLRLSGECAASLIEADPEWATQVDGKPDDSPAYLDGFKDGLAWDLGGFASIEAMRARSPEWWGAMASNTVGRHHLSNIWVINGDDDVIWERALADYVRGVLDGVARPQEERSGSPPGGARRVYMNGAVSGPSAREHLGMVISALQGLTVGLGGLEQLATGIREHRATTEHERCRLQQELQQANAVAAEILTSLRALRARLP